MSHQQCTHALHETYESLLYAIPATDIKELTAQSRVGALGAMSEQPEEWHHAAPDHKHRLLETFTDE